MTTKKGFIVPLLIVIAALLLIGGAYYSSRARTAPQAGTAGEDGASGMKEYSGDGISFSYPSALSLEDDGETVTLEHSIPYEHPDPCDFKGGSAPLARLTDFDVSITAVDQGAESYVKSAGWPDWEYVSKNPYSVGSFTGYSVTAGVEGCGRAMYYLEASPDKTIVVSRDLVGEFASVNGGSEAYLALPGAISPNRSDAYLEGILSSLKVK